MAHRRTGPFDPDSRRVALSLSPLVSAQDVSGDHAPGPLRRSRGHLANGRRRSDRAGSRVIGQSDLDVRWHTDTSQSGYTAPPAPTSRRTRRAVWTAREEKDATQRTPSPRCPCHLRLLIAASTSFPLPTSASPTDCTSYSYRALRQISTHVGVDMTMRNGRQVWLTRESPALIDLQVPWVKLMYLGHRDPGASTEAATLSPRF